MIYIIIIIILVLFLLNWNTRRTLRDFDNSLKKININECNFRTGDILFFRNTCPLYFYGDNGINMDVAIVKNTLKSLYFYHQKYYTHVGIIIVLDEIPYLLHMTADSQYDIYTNRYVIGSISMIDLREIENYKGYAYINRYTGPDIIFTKNDLDEIYSDNMFIDGNLAVIFKNTVLGIGSYRKNYGVCCDLVKKLLYRFKLINNLYPCDLNELINFVDMCPYYDSEPVMIRTGYFIALK